ncbi:MAG: hypothetical protein AAF517_16185 [Planctomycetota bacterium]
MAITKLGQYWSAEKQEVRLLVANDDGAWDVHDRADLPHARRAFRSSLGGDWGLHRWTYERLPFPSTELVETLEARGRTMAEWASQFEIDAADPSLDLVSLAREPETGTDHLVAPIIPRRAMAFGVTYLNSALERETEGRRSDYGYVYRSVKDRDERPELFLKGTSPEHIVGPGGRMGPTLSDPITHFLGRAVSPASCIS